MRSIWLHRLAFAGLAAAVTLAALVPLGGGEGGWPGPELIVCLVAAWVLRRPDYVPVWLLIPVLLLDDVLLMRPLGLWTLIVLVMSEYMRRRTDPSQALPFGSEMALVAGCIAAAFAANHLALVVLLAPTPPLGGQVLHAGVTIAFYPLVALSSHLAGIRRLAPGEPDPAGTRA